jgi:hypothetical protein
MHATRRSSATSASSGSPAWQPASSPVATTAGALPASGTRIPSGGSRACAAGALNAALNTSAPCRVAGFTCARPAARSGPFSSPSTSTSSCSLPCPWTKRTSRGTTARQGRTSAGPGSKTYHPITYAQGGAAAPGALPRGSVLFGRPLPADHGRECPGPVKGRGRPCLRRPREARGQQARPRGLVEACLEESSCAAPAVRLLRPAGRPVPDEPRLPRRVPSLGIPVEYHEEDGRRDGFFWDAEIRRFQAAVSGPLPQG